MPFCSAEVKHNASNIKNYDNTIVNASQPPCPCNSRKAISLQVFALNDEAWDRILFIGKEASSNAFAIRYSPPTHCR